MWASADRGACSQSCLGLRSEGPTSLGGGGCRPTTQRARGRRPAWRRPGGKSAPPGTGAVRSRAPWLGRRWTLGALGVGVRSALRGWPAHPNGAKGTESEDRLLCLFRAGEENYPQEVTGPELRFRAGDAPASALGTGRLEHRFPRGGLHRSTDCRRFASVPPFVLRSRWGAGAPSRSAGPEGPGAQHSLAGLWGAALGCAACSSGEHSPRGVAAR